MKDNQIGDALRILKKEAKQWDVPVVELMQVQTKDPFKVLLTTILSARTQDGTTAKSAKRLFTKVKNFKDLEKISQHELEKLIFPVGFYKTKAKHLKQLPAVMKEKFKKIPDTVEELTELPGVGRKTANLVRNVAFSKPAIAVDTHVHRISNRWGYVHTKTPHETEMALRKKLPKKHWMVINYLLVAFGQNICRPINPHCWECPVAKYCDYYKKVYLPSKRSDRD